MTVELSAGQERGFTNIDVQFDSNATNGTQNVTLSGRTVAPQWVVRGIPSGGIDLVNRCSTPFVARLAGCELVEAPLDPFFSPFVDNVGDGNKSGQIGGDANLRGTIDIDSDGDSEASFDLRDGETWGVGQTPFRSPLGQTTGITLIIERNKRGPQGGAVTVNFDTGSDDGSGNSGGTEVVPYSFTGVAPVSKVTLGGVTLEAIIQTPQFLINPGQQPDAPEIQTINVGNVLVGTSTETNKALTIANVGDGNRIDPAGNLLVDDLLGEVFIDGKIVGADPEDGTTVLSIQDSFSTTATTTTVDVPIAVTARQRSDIETSNIFANFGNGSPDDFNRAHSYTAVAQYRAVAPVAEVAITGAPDGDAKVLVGQTIDMGVEISNVGDGLLVDGAVAGTVDGSAVGLANDFATGDLRRLHGEVNGQAFSLGDGTDANDADDVLAQTFAASVSKRGLSENVEVTAQFYNGSPDGFNTPHEQTAKGAQHRDKIRQSGLFPQE